MRIFGLLAIVALAVTAAAFVSDTRSASADASTCSAWGCDYASAKFQSYGEHFIICDNEVDGYGAAVQYTTNGQNVHTLINDTGGNNCIDINKSWKESTRIAFWVCHERHGVVYTNTCGDPVTTTAAND